MVGKYGPVEGFIAQHFGVTVSGGPVPLAEIDQAWENNVPHSGAAIRYLIGVPDVSEPSNNRIFRCLNS